MATDICVSHAVERYKAAVWRESFKSLKSIRLAYAVELEDICIRFVVRNHWQSYRQWITAD